MAKALATRTSAEEKRPAALPGNEMTPPLDFPEAVPVEDAVGAAVPVPSIISDGVAPSTKDEPQSVPAPLRSMEGSACSMMLRACLKQSVHRTDLGMEVGLAKN